MNKIAGKWACKTKTEVYANNSTNDNLKLRITMVNSIIGKLNTKCNNCLHQGYLELNATSFHKTAIIM